MKKYSKIARAVKDYLEEYVLSEYDITLEEEYRAGNGLRYDFCFPYLEKMVAIEADGIQHNKFVPFFHKNIQGFKESKYRDFHKNFNTAMNDGIIIRVCQGVDVKTFLDEELEAVKIFFKKGDVKWKKKRKIK